jgi:hypothetical protein
MTVTRLLAMLAFVGLLAWPASAQERFSFVVATPRPDEERIPTAKPVSMLAGPQRWIRSPGDVRHPAGSPCSAWRTSGMTAATDARHGRPNY